MSNMIADLLTSIGRAYPRFSPASQRPRSRASAPAEFLHGPAGVPDFCHVPDLVAGEIHDIDVIGGRALAGRRAGAALARMGGREDAIGAHAVPVVVGGKRLHVIAAVRHE